MTLVAQKARALAPARTAYPHTVLATFLFSDIIEIRLITNPDQEEALGPSPPFECREEGRNIRINSMRHIVNCQHYLILYSLVVADHFHQEAKSRGAGVTSSYPCSSTRHFQDGAVTNG